jgi:hypothetical protein
MSVSGGIARISEDLVASGSFWRTSARSRIATYWSQSSSRCAMSALGLRNR